MDSFLKCETFSTHIQTLQAPLSGSSAVGLKNNSEAMAHQDSTPNPTWHPGMARLPWGCSKGLLTCEPGGQTWS